MTTLAQLIQQTKDHLLGNTREEINRLSASYTAAGTSLTLEFPMRSILADADIEIDSEIFRVISVAGQVATVMGAQYGTTAASHSSGALVIVNPRFRRASIIADLNHALDDLAGEGIYREVAIDVTFNPVVSGYDLTGSTPANVLDILEVRYQQTGPTKRFPNIKSFSLLRDMNTADFASGTALMIDSPGFPGLPLRVRYSSLFTPLAALSDDVTTTCGLRATADDLPPIGAAIRQMMGREVKRSFLEAQPDTRRAQEVPPGTARNAITELRRMWEMGVAAERMRQVQRFPYRMAN